MIEVQRFRDGDHEHFAELVREHGSMVLGVIRAHGHAPREEDLYQTVWAQVWRKRQSYRGDGPFGGWLYRVAVNVCRSAHRKRETRTRIEGGVAMEERVKDMVWSPPDPLSDAVRSQVLRRLRRALLELPDRQREALVLCRLEGRKATEAAQMMGVEPATVRSLIRHALERLSLILEGPDEDLSGTDPAV